MPAHPAKSQQRDLDSNKVFQAFPQSDETCHTERVPRAKQFSSDFIIGDFWNDDAHTSIQQMIDPSAARTAFFGFAVPLGRQTEGRCIERYTVENFIRFPQIRVRFACRLASSSLRSFVSYSFSSSERASSSAFH